jgi:hypothetical protein
MNVLMIPPPTAPSSASDNSIGPAGFCGRDARSASLRLSRKSSSFHARMVLRLDTAYFSFEISNLAIKPIRARRLGTKLGTYKANVDTSARAELI